MKKRNLIALLFLLVASVQTAWSQAGMLVWENGKYVGFHISHVDSVQFVENATNYIGSEYVDLGLPSGTLWATCNVGAESPEQAGSYFAWGETKPKDYYGWETYAHCKGSYETLTKYCPYSSHGYDGYQDDRSLLDPEDDAATANWGADWQMPTEEQFTELINDEYTTMELTTLNGVEGVTFRSKSNASSIFLPFAGEYHDGTLHQGTEIRIGSYWAKNLNILPNGRGRYGMKVNIAYFTPMAYISADDRCSGLSVRPVRKQPRPQHDFVDLALPSGTLWANCNIGANAPEDYGSYFAWGETKAKTLFTWENYQLCNGSDSELTEYCINSDYGTVDGRIVLQSLHDAATYNWGFFWEMPSMAQFEELLNGEYTTVQKTMQNDVYGMLITSRRNGHSIFLPAAGMYDEDYLFNDGSRAYYWSRQLYTDTDNPTYACDFNFDTRYTTQNDKQLRYNGLSIRPVRKQTHDYVDLELPSGTLWATTNIGAQNPADSGDFFAWGETRPKSNYSWETYKWMKPGQADWTQINKYTWSDGKTEGCWYVGETCQADYKDKLDPADDAATVNWGDEWQMPTGEQWRELLNNENTTYEWTQQSASDGYLSKGYLITSKRNRKSIFIPASGFYEEASLTQVDYVFNYWRLELDRDDSSCAQTEVNYGSNSFVAGSRPRSHGLPVRPVRK